MVEPTAKCQRCRDPLGAQHAGRRLHKRCYSAARRDGTLIDYERMNRPADEVLEDLHVVVLRDPTITRARAAAALNMTVAALDQVVYRARRRGTSWAWRRTPGAA